MSSILARLEQAQSNHGIPHQDYAQYHAYCTKRLARLRRVKEVRSLLVHNPKFVSSSSSSTSESGGGQQQQRSKGGGGRHAYAPRPVFEDLKKKKKKQQEEEEGKEDAASSDPSPPPHENVLWNILVQAERAWAQACEFQQQHHNVATSSATAATGASKSNQHHILRRLNKASKLATQAADHATAAGEDQVLQLSALQQQELKSYAAWMKGNVALHQKQHLAAFRSFQESRQILLQLVQQLKQSSINDNSSSKSQLALRDLWTTRAESLLKPLVRYCHYEAREELQESDLLVLPEEEQDGAASSSSSAAVSSIVLSFRGQDIALDEYKELAVVYLKLEDQLLRQKKKTSNAETDDQDTDSDHDETQFLQLLSDLDDALNWTKTELSSYESLPDGPAVNAKRQQLSTATAYFSYLKLDLQRQQQEKRLVLYHKKHEHDQDVMMIVHMYDTLQQSAQAMADLLLSSSSSDGDQQDSNNMEDDPYWLQAQAHVVRIRAFRCYYLARLYEQQSSLLQGTPAQVLALLKHSRQLAKQAAEEVAACMDDDDDDDDNAASGNVEESEQQLQALEGLERDIQIMTCRVQATQFLQSTSSSAGGGSSSNTDRPLWLRLDDFDAGLPPTFHLADDPPLLIPLPAKPVFLDIAGQYILSGDGEDNAAATAIQNYLEEHQEETKSTSSGGGLFSGWFS